MDILIVDPFYDTSHKVWAEGYQKNSFHKITILSLPPRFWKWRMYASSIELARRYQKEGYKPDLIIATDMMDLALFKSLLHAKLAKIPIALYFHENQLTYPWSENDKDVALRRDRHYAFMNYTSALVADRVLFNSEYHHTSFSEALPTFLSAFPDYQNLKTVDRIQEKSSTLYLGLDLTRFDKYQVEVNSEVPILLWNHRWEYDKNPETYFSTLIQLAEEGFNFQVIVVGSKSKVHPKIFDEAKIALKDRIYHWGYADTFAEYASLVWKSDILPVTNIQDFFGISIMESAYCETELILPHRLTYPELFPLADFYHDDDELYEILKQKILKFNERKDKQSQRDVAESYSWENQVATYDNMMVSILENHRHKNQNSIV